MISESEILNQLDQSSAEFTFPMLDNGYYYPITQRLSCYRDAVRWALVIECFGYTVRVGDHDGAHNCVHLYGNCLDHKPGLRNEDFICVSEDAPEGPTFDDWYIHPEAHSINIRGEVLQFDVSEMSLKTHGVKMVTDRPTAPDLFRVLALEYREKLLATEQELRQRIPADLPLLLKLDDWHHPDIANGEKPSESEVFQLLAKVIASGDLAFYAPSLPPNTHWSNWPAGGSL